EASRLLAQRGTSVRVLVRNPEKVSALAQIGVEVCKGDLEDPATVDKAMQGVTSVVLVSPAVPRQELGVVDRAVRARVQHGVRLVSKASVDSPIARRRGQFEIEKGLIASGLGYTLLKNNAYTQNFLMMGRSIADKSSFGTATGDGRIGHVDTRDIAAVAAPLRPPHMRERRTGRRAPKRFRQKTWRRSSREYSIERSHSNRSRSPSRSGRCSMWDFRSKWPRTTPTPSR